MRKERLKIKILDDGIIDAYIHESDYIEIVQDTILMPGKDRAALFETLLTQMRNWKIKEVELEKV